MRCDFGVEERIMNRLAAACAALTFLLASAVVARSADVAATAKIADILAAPAAYDGKHLVVSGTAAHVEHRTSHRGNAYTVFDLCDGSTCLHVFSFGSPTVNEGATISVPGTFAAEKHVGSQTFKNELDVDQGGLK
jgi:hypothetical protein